MLAIFERFPQVLDRAAEDIQRELEKEKENAGQSV
jgi:hypothetical protein